MSALIVMNYTRSLIAINNFTTRPLLLKIHSSTRIFLEILSTNQGAFSSSKVSNFCLKPRMKESKLAKLNQQQQQYNHQNVHLSPSKVANLFDPDASWDKDQLGDVLHWIRQVVGLICGLLWGSVPLVGGIWIILFLAISSGIVYGYYAMILKVDEEDFGGHAALLQEGLFASVTLFLLAWILVYSLAHF